MEDRGRGIVEAAVETCRLQPIVMTSVAFIAGVVPLVLLTEQELAAARDGERRVFVYTGITPLEGPMKRSHLLCAAVLGMITVAAQAADPEFNKECAMGLAMKQHIPTDCSVTWTADNGKVYCFVSEDAKAEFLKTPEVHIAGAETFWSP